MRSRRAIIAATGTAVAVLSAVIWMSTRSRTWTRQTPLKNPIAVVAISNGVIQLEDGQSFSLAGITRRDAVRPDGFDAFLTIATAQGVCLTRALDRSRAFLVGEPKFHNWCGTNRRWAGSYSQAPLSELAIVCGYADPDLTQTDLTPREAWRLEGSSAFRWDDEPMSRVESLNAFRYSSIAETFSPDRDLDAWIHIATNTPPPNDAR